MKDILYKETEKTNMISSPVQRVNSYEENGIAVEGKHIFPHKTDPNKRIVTIQNKKFDEVNSIVVFYRLCSNNYSN